MHADEFPGTDRTTVDLTLKPTSTATSTCEKQRCRIMKPGSAIVDERLSDRPARRQASARLFDDKGGIHALTRSHARHLVERGIRSMRRRASVWTPSIRPTGPPKRWQIRQPAADEAARASRRDSAGFVFSRAGDCSSYITGEIRR